ncbi:MAG TPA: hypothetical protein VFE78_35910 [Gemmataceae bacterium]|jgi:hypothetical protein|nr:hypothetical protein [Gemmataceae bacterium]
MNVTDTRDEMLACVAELRRRLAAVPDPAGRADLADEARRKIERLRKRFKRRIDEKSSRRFGFPINSREGIERRLAEATATALAAVEQAVVDHAEPPAAPGPTGQ